MAGQGSGSTSSAPSTVILTTGISEDAAMLLAYDKGAELIVAVGTRFNLIEFLERNRRQRPRPFSRG